MTPEHAVISGAPQSGAAHAGAAQETVAHGEQGSNRLGAFLCWAVVFADIGTSVYYVPGILFSQVGRLAGLFVTMTLIVFILLTLKYAEVSVRFPEGGGVVTVAARGINPWAGAVGGMFILVDYFLTSAISSLSGLQYFTDIVPAIEPVIVPATLIVVALLGLLNWWGIRESATVSAVIAIAALLSDMAILVVVFTHVPLHTIGLVFTEIFRTRRLSGGLLLTGFAGSFLAFSGLESISQLSPVMRLPRHKTVTWALAFVAITVGVTSPLLTIFSTTLLNATKVDPSKFISALGGAYGGDVLKVATAITASALLVFASNTAIIGAYHVFLALSRMHFFPTAIEHKNKLRGTPHVAIGLATGIPMIVLVAVRGQINILGDMYAFGLLGAFSLTCIALDIIRMRERRLGTPYDARAEEALHESLTSGSAPQQVPPGAWHQRLQAAQAMATRWSDPPRMRAVHVHLAHARGAMARLASPVARAVHRMWPSTKYFLGFLTSALVSLAWLTNLYTKPLATAFGGSMTVLGVGIAVANYRHQMRAGVRPVYPRRHVVPMPGSVLVVLPSGEPANMALVQAAVAGAAGRPLVFLGLGMAPAQPVRMMAIHDPYDHDADMQRVFSLAANLCRQTSTPAEFIYRRAYPGAVTDTWRVVQAEELMAAAGVAKRFTFDLSPEYVRFQMTNGVRIAHHMRHHHRPMDASNTIASSLPTGRSSGTGTKSESRSASAPPEPATPSNPPRTAPAPPANSAAASLPTQGSENEGGRGDGAP